MTDYDAIIIGAGHNGLICASYLAKAGKNVMVPRSKFPRTCATAGFIACIKYQYVFTCFGEVAGADQSVMARADD